MIEDLRLVKSLVEVEAIRRSVETCSGAFDRAMKRARAGMKELDLAAEIDYQMRRMGADQPAFETIVASGERAALPHARPTCGLVARDRLLLIDMGASRGGYASDMTRMACFGRPSPAAKGLYRAVREAQIAATNAVRAGVTAGSVDRAARTVLRRHSLDRAFAHSTGHGLGLEIHEAPRLGKGVKTRLEAGMVVTIEPGAYIADEGGVRIEDMVLVTAKGCEVMTLTSKELLVLE
jgi:Xaa-Pro aminopeptidase